MALLALLIDYMAPALAFAGAFALILLALAIAFWPWIESPLIAFLCGVRAWRTQRKLRRPRRRP